MRVNGPRILKGESGRFRSVQVNDKKITKLSVKKNANVASIAKTFSLIALSNFTDRPFFSQRSLSFDSIGCLHCHA